MITPNEGQTRALEEIEPFLGSGEPFFILKGSAGTGKTSLLNFVPDINPRGEIIGCGPTHKSVGVLADKLPESIECCTIHSFLGLRPKRSGEKTTLIRRKDFDPSEKAMVRLVLLDEGSMIGKELLEHIKADADYWDRQYLIIGDPYQLNPVNELDTPCFHMGANGYELTEIVRQAQDNPIIKCATAIRNAIMKDQEPPVITGVNGEFGVQRMTRKNWMTELTKHVAHADPDEYRILAYRNDTVRKYNQMVREILGKDLSVPFSPGEYVVVNEAFVQNEEVIMNTGLEFLVDDMEPYEHPYYNKLKGWMVTIGLAKVPVLDHEKCGDEYKRIIASLVQYAKEHHDWRAYYQMAEFWCDLRPLYAMTVHKSQGSTFDNVFIDYADIYANRVLAEADRCLYVAVTRPRYNAYILG